MALPGTVLGSSFEEPAKLGNEGGGRGEVDAPGVLDLAGVVARAVAAVVGRILPGDRAQPMHGGLVTPNLGSRDAEPVGGLGDREPDDRARTRQPVDGPGPAEKKLEMIDQRGRPSRRGAHGVEEIPDLVVVVSFRQAMEGRGGPFGYKMGRATGAPAGRIGAAGVFA